MLLTPTIRDEPGPTTREYAAPAQQAKPWRDAPPYQQELRLHFQPRCALESGARVALQALMRAPHLRRGPLLAACREAAGWAEPLMVAVALSPVQLSGGALPGRVAMALQESGLPAERLELGLAESTLVEADAEMLLGLSAVRDMGAGIALDDFGTGLASLAMLRRLPLTAMKLDHALLRNLPRDREDAAIVRAAIAAGRAVGLTVIADGVEHAPQRGFLVGLGCEQGQGGLFGAPAPAEAFRPA